MMEFYKKRDFGTFISDSFNFFKVYGKNYLKNYILKLHDEVFYFNPKEVITSKLTTTQKKNYHQWQVLNYWKIIDVRKRNREKKSYKQLQKKEC